MKALLLGSTGYTGQLLLTLLARHPRITQIGAVSTSMPHAPVTNPVLIHSNKLIHPYYIPPDDIQERYDVIFSALPHGNSIPAYLTLPPHGVYIDLSADFRFGNIDTYMQVYGKESTIQKNTALIKAMRTAVYGLSEFHRELLTRADIIACPGCYPTSILIPLIPILRHCTPSASIAVTSISGISGAGSRPQKHMLYSERTENLHPYAIGRTHRHYFEIQDQLEKTTHCTPSLTFTPVLAPLKQGILSIIHIPLPSHDIPRAVEAVRSQYIDEPFISVVSEESVDTASVKNTNNIIISLHKEQDSVIATAVIDNLWKGAAGQAIQNFNIRFGFQEIEGLEYVSL